MSAVRQSARGEECTLRFDGVCNHNRETVVFCHSNRLEDGKGMGLKARIGCYGCSACHDMLDGRSVRPAWITYDAMMNQFDKAVIETQQKLMQKGLPIMDDYAKAAHKIARRIPKAKTKWGKRKMVSEWAKNMKAMIKAGRK
jgi:hypothetical protein